MPTLRRTRVFDAWLVALRDRHARVRIEARLTRIEEGLPGNWKPVGGGVFEVILDFGPGYRVYFTRHGKTSILLICGGDKASHRRDIVRARTLAVQLEITGDVENL